ncbi:MAG: hypothetical protein RQ715_02360 [Methylococcales bacterium]|nr:hypothetical protein [Methylococcales bacterium]
MQRIFLTLTLIATALIALSGLTTYWLHHGQIEDARSTQNQQLGQQSARLMGHEIQLYRQLISRIAQTTELKNAVANHAQAAFAATEQRLRTIIPNVVQVRILTPEDLAPSEHPDLSLADLAMVRQSFQTATLPAIHGADHEPRHLAISERIDDNQGQAVAVLLVTLTAQHLTDLFRQSLTPAPGGLQRLAQGQLVLAQQGNNQLASNAPQHSIPITQSHLAVELWPEHNGQTESLTTTAIIIGATCLLFMLFVFLTHRRLATMLAEDQNSLIKAVQDLMQDKLQDSYPAHFSEMNSVINSLIQFKRIRAHGDTTVSGATPGSGADDFDSLFSETSFTLDELLTPSIPDVSQPETPDTHGAPPIKSTPRKPS